MSNRETYRNLLTYALAIAGSERQLAARLGVTIPRLLNYLMGIEDTPTDIFLKAVDVVLTATAEEVRQSRATLEQIKSKSYQPKPKT